jgi:hypothetical protein
VPDWVEPYWTAYCRLIRGRQYAGLGGDPLPIDEESIIRYAGRAGITDPDDVEDLILVINAVDDHVRKVIAADAEQSRQRQK